MVNSVDMLLNRVLYLKTKNQITKNSYARSIEANFGSTQIRTRIYGDYCLSDLAETETLFLFWREFDTDHWDG